MFRVYKPKCIFLIIISDESAVKDVLIDVRLFFQVIFLIFWDILQGNIQNVSAILPKNKGKVVFVMKSRFDR